MTYLDSNVIIRIITGDNPKVANELIDTILNGNKNDFFITSSVLVEVCFVLEFHDYAMKRNDIFMAISRLFNAPQVKTSQATARALILYSKHTKLDFTDCYLLAKLKDQNHTVLSLDKDLNKVANSY
jgi:predicted nucleic-acid-binding protein